MWKVVIIDDDRQVLRSMTKLIPWKQLNATCVGQGMDGRQGLELIASQQPDIVLTDVYMPVMNGLEMIEKLKNKGYPGKIIILSGYSDFEYARRALQLNVTDYLSKPVQLQTLQQVLTHAIGQLEEEAIQKLAQKDLQNKLTLFEPLAKQQFLFALLTGTMRSGEAYQHFQRFVQTNEYRHAVLAIEIERTERWARMNIADWNLIRYAVGNITKEVMQEAWPGSEFVELHGNYAAIWLHCEIDRGEAYMDHKIKALSERIIHCNAKFLNVALYLGLGEMKLKWNQVHESTEEAFYALSVKQNAGHSDDGLFRYASVSNPDSPDRKPRRLSAIMFYRRLAEAIQGSSQHEIIALIEEHLRPLTSYEYSLSSLDLHSFITELWTIIAYSYHEQGVMLEEIYPAEGVQAEIKSISSAVHMEQWLIDKINAIHHLLSLRVNVKHRQAVEAVLKYINEHYAQDISLSELSEKLQLSRNHLGVIFRNTIGETFNSYLTRIRMENAKKLLREGKYYIYEVSEMVGYKNVAYFSTLFKKYTNYKPSDLFMQPQTVYKD